MASPRYESPSGTVTKYKFGKTELLVFTTVLAVFLVLFYLYCKWRRWCSNATATRRTRSSVIFRRSTSRLVFEPNHNYVTSPSKGLDPFEIQLLSSTVYNADDSSDEVLQCAVCLSDVTEGEMIRLLPRCNHGFHVECIDMWFFSHSTCPLCRKTVVAEQANTTTVTPVREVIPIDENSVESSTIGSSSSSTNVNLYEELNEATTLPLSTASSTLSSTASKEIMMLTIEIPARDFSLEDTKPKSAMTRLGSLKRLLSIRSQKRWLKTSYSFSSTRSCVSPTVPHDDGIPHVAIDIVDGMH